MVSAMATLIGEYLVFFVSLDFDLGLNFDLKFDLNVDLNINRQPQPQLSILNLSLIQ